MCVWILSRNLDKYNWGIFVGLLFAILGDITMELNGDIIFIVGVVLNMLALVFYTIYFIRSDRSLKILRLIPFLAIMSIVYIVIFKNLGIYKIPIFIYDILYAVFLWRSSARLGDKQISVLSQWVCFIGCVIITTSDSLLGLSLFKPNHYIFDSYFVTMALWWMGQLMMAITAVTSPEFAGDQNL